MTKMALLTSICLVTQGYIFTHVLGVNPGVLITISPLLLYLAFFLVAAARGVYGRPGYWAGAIVALTAVNISLYAVAPSL